MIPKPTSTHDRKFKRFFYHYNKPESVRQDCNVLTLHWEDTCHLVNDIEVQAHTETHSQKHQPRCIMRGWAYGVLIYKTDEGLTKAVVYGADRKSSRQETSPTTGLVRMGE